MSQLNKDEEPESELATDTASIAANQTVLSDTDDDTEDDIEDSHKDDVDDEQKLEKSAARTQPLARRSRAPRAATVDPLDLIGREVEQTFPKFGSALWRGTVRSFSVACLRLRLFPCFFWFIFMSSYVHPLAYVLSMYACVWASDCVFD